MLSAFDEERAARIVRVVEMRVVAQPAPRTVTFVDDQVLRHADTARELEPLALPSRQRECRAGVGHRVEVEEKVRVVIERTQCPRTLELSCATCTIEHLRIPQPVEILVEAARRERILVIEALVRLHIGKHQRQRPAQRAELDAQQPVKRDRAADLVAVRERLNRHPRPGDAGRKAPNERDTGVAGRPGFEIRKRDFDRRLPWIAGFARVGAPPGGSPASGWVTTAAGTNRHCRALPPAWPQPARSCSARRSMNASHRASWSRPIHSSGW